MELIESFEFSPAPGDVEILRVPAGLMSPMYLCVVVLDSISKSS